MRKIIFFIFMSVWCFSSCMEHKDKQYTPKDVADLANLCKVWGFLRFYHPEIVFSDKNWDNELFEMMPLVLNSKTKEEKNRLLSDWIKRQGEVKPLLTPLGIDSSQIKIAPNFDWMNDPNLGEVGQQLIYITKNVDDSFYLETDSTLLSEMILKSDKAYPDLPPYPDVTYRLLTLFRYWNIVEYCFPYKYLIGENWDSVLYQFIPQFIEVQNELEYKLLLLKLIASINDTHAYSSLLYDATIADFKGVRNIPVQLSFVENKAVVVNVLGNYINPLKKGDVIESVNGVAVDSIVKQKSPYVAASNYPAKLYKISAELLRTNQAWLGISYKRGQEVFFDSINTHIFRYPNLAQSTRSLLCTLDHNIQYIYVGSENGGKIPDKIDSKGIIIDLRCYPNFDIENLKITQLYPKETECAKFSIPIMPGLFVFDMLSYLSTSVIGIKNPNYYKGKVIILTNEITISAAEFDAMCYRCAPNTTVIGSTTAGADGDTFHFILPGGIKTMFSGLGVYYPDGTETQRIGIVPDIEIKPTIKGIQEGRDEVLEKAIELINL